MSGAAALALRGIRKTFGTVRALNDAEFRIAPGTIHALLGENGAGKTTLMRIAFGLHMPDAGVIEVHGTPVHFRGPHAAIAAGIGMVHQHFSLVPALTVAENLALGGRGAFHFRAAVQHANALATSLGLDVDARALVADLSVPAQQRVEILKALSRDASILILDEPTAVLAPSETAELMRRLRAFASAGRAIVLITHKLDDALRVADSITVLRAGATVLSTRAAETSADELVIAMIGERPARRSVSRASVGDVVAALRDATVIGEQGVPRLRKATIDVHAGEIVGVAGVDGSGHAELLRLLAGRLRPTDGSAMVPQRVGFVPVDRHRDALVLDFPLFENLAVADVAQRRGAMPWRRIESETTALIERTGVVAAGARARAASLSGGNQQRFVIARELAHGHRALVLENPTRGLDVRASLLVHDELRAARAADAAVVFYSSDIDELIALADRVVVCFSGRVHEVPLDAAAIGYAMTGALDGRA